jgi:hypothetical protein
VTSHLCAIIVYWSVHINLPLSVPKYVCAFLSCPHVCPIRLCLSQPASLPEAQHSLNFDWQAYLFILTKIPRHMRISRTLGLRRTHELTIFVTAFPLLRRPWHMRLSRALGICCSALAATAVAASGDCPPVLLSRWSMDEMGSFRLRNSVLSGPIFVLPPGSSLSPAGPARGLGSMTADGTGTDFPRVALLRPIQSSVTAWFKTGESGKVQHMQVKSILSNDLGY